MEAVSEKAPLMPCYIRTSHVRNPNFVGRSDVIKEIDKILLPSSQSAATGLREYVLSGFGGIGKTQIALYYAFERDDYFDAVFWVQADDITKLAKDFDTIAHCLGLLTEAELGDRVVSRSVVLEWLSNPRQRRPPRNTTDANRDTASHSEVLASWLIIFDNADDIDILRDYWPIGATGSVLVTTRNPKAKDGELTVTGTDVAPMSDIECALLLRKLVDEPSGTEIDKSAAILANKIGCVPLAISQIAALIRRRDMTISEFLKEYGGAGQLLQQLNQVKGLPLQEQYKKTIETVWGFEHFSKSALSLLHAMVFMDPDGVAESILEQKFSGVPVKSYPSPGDEFIKTRTELSNTSLVRRNKEKKTLSWHRLIQEVARERMSNDELQLSLEFSIRLLYQQWKFITRGRFDREKFKREESDKVVPQITNIVKNELNSALAVAMDQGMARKFVHLLQESSW
jgi:hypothetical protein